MLPDAPEEPGAAAVNAGVPGALDVTAVREVWPEIVTAIGRQSKKVAALASGATVRDLDGDTVVLTFRFPAHAKMVAPEAAVISNALYEALGGRWQVRCEVAGEGGAIAVAPTSGGPSQGGGHGSAPGNGGGPRNEPARGSGSRAQASAPVGGQQAVRATERAPQSRRRTEDTPPPSDDDWPEPVQPGDLGPSAAPVAVEEPAEEENGWPEVRQIGGPAPVASHPGEATAADAGDSSGGGVVEQTAPAGLGGTRASNPAGLGGFEASKPASPGSLGASEPASPGGFQGSEPARPGGFQASEAAGPGGFGVSEPASPGRFGASEPASLGGFGASEQASAGGFGASKSASPEGFGASKPASAGEFEASTSASAGEWEVASPKDAGGPRTGVGNRPAPGKESPIESGSGRRETDLARPSAVDSTGAAGVAAEPPAPARPVESSGRTAGGRNAGPKTGLAAARAAAAAAANARSAGVRQAPKPGGSAWSDGTPAEEAPYDPEFDGAPAAAASSSFEGFDPGDEPLDDVIDEKTARESSEQQAMRLLQEAFGAEKIGES